MRDFDRDRKLNRRKLLAGGLCLALSDRRFGAAPAFGKEGAADADEPTSQSANVAEGGRGAVATVHPRATAAAMQTLRSGGNAADAAVAAALMLAVVDGHNSGLGGGCFILARRSSGEFVAIDGRETAPAAATPRMFIRGNTPRPLLSKIGPLASGVPGAVAAYHRLSERLGTGRWADAVQAAARVAEEGFELSPPYAARLASVAERLEPFEGSRQIFLHPDGTPLAAGEQLIQQDLAQTLREISDGPDAFYRGSFAERLSRWMDENGGLITQSDMRGYNAIMREPVKTTFRSHQIYGFPPPSSGGVHVAQILGMLERFDLEDLHEERRLTFYHLIAEAMRRAFADRATWLGDPAFADVPRELVSPDYLQRRSLSIDERRVSDSVAAGTPPKSDSEFFAPRHTTHLSVADADGNWIAITTTVNTTLGSKVVIPGTGVVMNNQMDDFAIAPGVPNAFGLVGRKANAPGPGKRPLSSMSPSIVVRDGVPILSCGAAGGPRIISATAMTILRVVGLNQGVSSALASPRVHHQWKPNTLFVEARLPDRIGDGLQRLGHELKLIPSIATAQAVHRRGDGVFVAASEPRVANTSAAAW